MVASLVAFVPHCVPAPEMLLYNAKDEKKKKERRETAKQRKQSKRKSGAQDEGQMRLQSQITKAIVVFKILNIYIYMYK